VLHLVLYGLLAIILAGGLFLLAARFLPAGEQIAPPLRDEPQWELPPDRMLAPEDVDTVRLPVALRGYRFAETDLLLDRLAAELRARDAEIVRLRGGGEPEPAPAEEPAEEPLAAAAADESADGNGRA
jgi:DivIVA domain-containing protein